MTYPKHIIVAGIGRSGTTWLGDLLNYDNQYRTIFEPFHPDQGVEMRREMYNGRYLRPDTEDPALRTRLLEIIEGRFSNEFADHYNANVETDKTLIKEIRIDLALGWIHRQFPDIPLVYILRHPGAVITSQMRMNWGDGRGLLKNMLRQPELMTDYLEPFTEILQPTDDEFTNRLLVWCAKIYTLLKQFRPNEMYWVCYETLWANTDVELEGLFSTLGIPYDREGVLELAGRPSATTWSTDQPPEEAIKQLDKWQKSLTEQPFELMMDTLEIFGLHKIYGRSSMPETDALNAMLTSKEYPELDSTALRHWKPLQDDWFSRQWRRLKRP
jgi:hypothetical protein